MVITMRWLERFATNRYGMGYTNEQMVALGVEVPPMAGWKERLVGTTLSDDAAAEFERLGDEQHQRWARTKRGQRGLAIQHQLQQRDQRSIESTPWSQWAKPTPRPVAFTDGETLTITGSWIHKHDTSGYGSWTQAQLAALGIATGHGAKWNPPKGWISRIEGQQISIEAAREFERLGAEGRARYQQRKANRQR